MFCSRCGKTLMPEDQQCPHCGTPVGESHFEGTPYTSAQAHILPNSPAGQASAAYTRTTYTTIPEEQQQQGELDSRTTYRPVYDDASAPEDIREDMRSAIDGREDEEARAARPEDLSEDARSTLNAVEEELKMENMDTSELLSRPIESTGRAGISTEVEDYIQKLEASQNRKAARRRRAVEDTEDAYATPQDEAAYDDTQPRVDDEQGEVFDDIQEEDFDEIRGRAIGVRDILKVALIMVVAAALIVGGVLGFRYFRQRAQNTSKIEGVTQSLYESGLELVKSHTDATYVNELTNLYRNDGVLGITRRIESDSAAIDALLPEDEASVKVNDPLYVSVLQTIQGNIGNAILMDVTEAAQVAGDSGQDSGTRWTIVNEAIAAVENATTAQELTAILNGERVTVATTPEPTPEPATVTYNTLTKGDKSDEVLELQNRLYVLGFLLDDRDGAFGSKTQTAVKLFQQAAGLEATGIADDATQQRLYAEDAPRTEYAQATPTPVPEEGASAEEAAA